MKKLASIIILAVALLAPIARAQAPVSIITMLGSNPTFDASGNILTAPVQSLWLTTVTVGGQSYSSQSSVSWDGTSTANTVTIGGVTVTYAQATAFIAAIATQERAMAPGTQAAAQISKAAAALKPTTFTPALYPKTYLALDGRNFFIDYGHGNVTSTLVFVEP